MPKSSHSQSEAWLNKLRSLKEEAAKRVSGTASVQALEDLRVRYLGRQGGLFSELFKSLKDFPIEERRLVGNEANALKDALSTQIDGKRTELEAASQAARLKDERLDWSLPAAPPLGRLHPITRTMREMSSILSSMGFALAEGPLVETDWYNFGALNLPEDHPARDMQDTFYLATPSIGAAARLMRTHTSPVQVRFMEGRKPPIRIQAPGRVFRHEATDASHSAVFHQVEGLCVDEGVTFADLKGTLQQFIRRLLGPSTETRFRPSYFPFTEPSAEVDVRCLLCSGDGCSACKRSGWMEMLGCGLVHPNVLRAGKQDPAKVSGYAFGIGVERVAMLRLGVPDIRLFYENDARFLEQFQ